MTRCGVLIPAGSLLARRYRVLAPLGSGGMATTYRVHDLLGDRELALKLLARPALEASFIAEFDRLRGLTHPHLTCVHGFGRETLASESRAFYTAELYEGGTLAARVREHGFEASLPAIADALEGLACLHALGVRHGDVKPDNVLCTPEGRGVLIDLGCARALSSVASDLSGTPGYMAPELLAGGAADERADLFAVGVMLRQLGAPPRLASLIEQLTAQSPRDRPTAVSDVLDALGQSRDLSITRRAPLVPMLGRDPELRQIAEALGRAAAGERGVRCVWLHGPPGVGRSRLWQEAIWDVAARVAVHEVRATQPACVRDVLSRATGAALAPGLEGLLAAVRTLSLGATPCVIAIDDAERLDASSARDLALLLRENSEDGRLSVLVSSTQPLPSDAPPHVLTIELGPLSRAALGAWSQGLVPAAALPALERYTGGYPAYVAQTLNALAAGSLRVSELRDGALPAAQIHHATVSQIVKRLDVSEQTALLRVALAAELPPNALAPRSARVQEVPVRLFALQLLRRDGREVTLLRDADREVVLSSCAPRLVKKLRLAAARTLASDGRPEALGVRLVHLLRADRLADACVVFAREQALILATPGPFLPFVRLAAGRLSPELSVQAASVARLCAQPQLALTLLSRARRETREARALLALRQEAAEIYLTLGLARRAERVSRELLALSPADSALCELRCRCLLKVGAHEQAAAEASLTLSDPGAAALRASLLEDLATAEAYLDRHAQALEHISEAAALHGAHAPRARARCLAFLSFVAFRGGDTARAADSAERVRELAEQHGFDDLLVTALTNLGSAREMQGALGTALDCYERGLRLALALDRKASVRSLRSNLANLSIELGLWPRARSVLAQLAADRGLAPPLAHAVTLYAAELDLLTGQPQLAEAQLVPCLTLLAARGAGRELSEGRALLALVRSELGDVPGARELAAQALHEAEALGGADLRARLATQLGRVAVRCGEGKAVAQQLERELKLASAAGLDLLLAGLHGVLSQIYDAAHSQGLSREHRERALSLWERIALDLAPSSRDAFWEHPTRRVLRREPPQTVEPKGRSTLNLPRIFELNRRLNSALSVRAVLDYAIDAATEITQAERGFVLLARPGHTGFEIAVARNLDRLRLSGDELRLSRSIAEQVIAHDEPLLTLDAGSDTRFAQQASVHAMRLKSVLCVPIRSPAGVLGALYLDTRLQRARFERSDLELLVAFADQVAVALTNARLVSDLESRTRELAREKQRVEALSAGQAVEITRLELELDKRQDTLETRYDYSQIVGRSEAMRRVLQVLDRVLDSDLSVLIQGESGTGKELVARAIHFNSPRKARPFLGLNCAAVPENLLESELFGVTRGAFTGADRDRTGLFVSAQGGTLFLDELQELTMPMQAKLLRVLQEREVRPVGATRGTPIDVRILCATNRDLSQRVREGAFREDLYYRVAVVDVTLPPLRARAEDIVAIAEALLTRRARETSEPKRELSADAVRALLGHPWPGNVRELENTLLRASVMAEGARITAQDLGLGRAQGAEPKQSRSRRDYEQKEAERLLSLLEAERWNVSRVAKQLGLARNTLYRKLARYGLVRGEAHSSS